MREGKTFGKRFEKKFITTASLFKSYLKKNKARFEKNFSADHYSEGVDYTLIENIYFDSEDLDSYHDSMAKNKIRHKLRIRRYAENGISNDLLFFEIKSKVYGETCKQRVALKESWLEGFMSYGSYPRFELLELNRPKTDEETLKIVDKILYFIHNLSFVPVLKSSYKRYAFKHNDKKVCLRLTMDQDLKFDRISKTISPKIDYEKTIAEDEMIVEVKYKDKEHLNYINDIYELLGSPRGFSKYCYGVFKTQMSKRKTFENLASVFSMGSMSIAKP